MYKYQSVGCSFSNKLSLFKTLSIHHWFGVDVSDPYVLNIPKDVFCFYIKKNKIWITSNKRKVKHDL